MKTTLALATAVNLCLPFVAGAQAPKPATPQAVADPAAAAGVTPPADYVIGPEDILSVFVWREKDLSTEVMVRPDGQVSLPLLNDVPAAGLTPEQFRQRVTEAASKYIEQPNVTVIVKAINSRKVFVTGEVEKPGPYPLGGPTTVVQLLAQAGGLREYADSKNITVMRTEAGKMSRLRVNYEDIKKGRRMEQNILLKPGDTVIVP